MHPQEGPTPLNINPPSALPKNLPPELFDVLFDLCRMGVKWFEVILEAKDHAGRDTKRFIFIKFLL